MKVLLIHLKRTEYLDDLLLALTQVGVYDPVILEALGGQDRLLSEVPIFAGLMVGEGKRSELHRIILAAIEDESVADRILRALSDGGIDWEAEDLGTLVVLPVERWIGRRGAKSGA